MTTHEALAIFDADQLFELVRDGSVFLGCVFDGAELADFDAEELELQACSGRGADFTELACQRL